MSAEACCTCASLLSSSLVPFDEKHPGPRPTAQRHLECCGRVICEGCTRKNPRFETYCTLPCRLKQSATYPDIGAPKARFASSPARRPSSRNRFANLQATPRPRHHCAAKMPISHRRTHCPRYHSISRPTRKPRTLSTLSTTPARRYHQSLCATAFLFRPFVARIISTRIIC